MQNGACLEFRPMNTLGSRIAHFRKQAGLSQAELAKLCHWKSQSRIGNYEKDLREPTLADLELMASALRVSVSQLTYGESAVEHNNVAPMLQPRREAREYPVLSWIAAGERVESSVAYPTGIADEWLSSTENAGPRGYWLRVRGHSMTANTPPSFPEGTPILIQPEGFDLISGKFYIARHTISGETTFKRYQLDAGIGYLVPLNPEYQTVPLDGTWEIIGRAIDAKITGM